MLHLYSTIRIIDEAKLVRKSIRHRVGYHWINSYIESIELTNTNLRTVINLSIELVIVNGTYSGNQTKNYHHLLDPCPGQNREKETSSLNSELSYFTFMFLIRLRHKFSSLLRRILYIFHIIIYFLFQFFCLFKISCYF